MAKCTELKEIVLVDCNMQLWSDKKPLAQSGCSSAEQKPFKEAPASRTMADSYVSYVCYASNPVLATLSLAIGLAIRE